jgi:hypothetical protein
MKQVKLIAALLLFALGVTAQTVTPDPGPYQPMNQKYEYRWIKTSGGIWNLGKFVQVDSAQFSGVTYVPTAPDNDSSLRVANTAWVKKNITAGSGGGIDSVRRKGVTDSIVEFYGGALGFRRFAFTAPLPGAFVPYTGATQDVNLGEFGLQTGNVEFDNTPTNLPTAPGSMYYNDTDGTLDLILKGGNVKLQIGQETVLRVVNKTATNINLLEANYQAVRVTGAQGQRVKVDLAQATTDALSAETIGLVTETINNNQEGFITTSGLVRNINTTGSLQSETWADGDIVYLSPTTAGRITNIKPVAPNHLVIIGYVIHSHATQGSIFVKVDNGYELDELHNVKITTPTNNQALVYNDTTDVWVNKSIITDTTSLSNRINLKLNISDTSVFSRKLLLTNRQTASYTLALTDLNQLVEMNVGSANTLTVPLFSSVAFAIGSKIDIAQYGAGQTTITAAGGVTIRSFSGALKIAGQYGAATLVKIGTNEWYCFGNLSL